MAKQTNKILEFFKPTIAKIAIALIIFIVFVPILSIDSGVRCITEPCDSQSTVSLVIYVISLFEGVKVFGFFYVNIIAGIVISYILSCFIVILVNFLKKKFKDI
jgi:hypothetical protein